MLSRDTAARAALSALESRRVENARVERERREDFARRSPEGARLMAQREALLWHGMEQAFAKPQEAQAISQGMRREMEALNAALRAELVRQHLPEDYLQPVASCPLCGDQGYVGEPVREMCTCLKGEILRRLYQDEGLQGLAEQNFDTFDANIFPDTPMSGRKHTQRGYMRILRERCERYADGFRPGTGEGLILSGETGVGKTFLMNCVAQRVLARGFSVVVISAYRLAETVRRNQWDGSEADLLHDLRSCDLLAVDDLGSEPLRGEGTVSGLYAVVSERTAGNASILVTTNCSAAQLYERYGDRIAARLCDPRRMQFYEVPGIDVRRHSAG